jgi:hypothetical protein
MHHYVSVMLCRSFFFSFILQARFNRPSINDTYDPGTTRRLTVGPPCPLKWAISSPQRATLFLSMSHFILSMSRLVSSRSHLVPLTEPPNALTETPCLVNEPPRCKRSHFIPPLSHKSLISHTSPRETSHLLTSLYTCRNEPLPPSIGRQIHFNGPQDPPMRYHIAQLAALLLPATYIAGARGFNQFLAVLHEWQCKI